MKLNKYLQATSNVFEEKRLLKFGFIVLLALTLMNWYSVDSMKNNEKVVIVPPGASGDLWLTSGEISDDYMMSMTRYIIKMTSSYTSRTARAQFADLKRLFCPRTVGEAQQQFTQLASEIEKYQSAAQQAEFSERDVKHDAQNKRIKVEIRNFRYINGVNTGSEKNAMLIDYDLDSSRFCIKTILEEKADDRV